MSYTCVLITSCIDWLVKISFHNRMQSQFFFVSFILTPSFPMFPFVFLMFSWGSKGNIGKNWVKVKGFLAVTAKAKLFWQR